MPKFKKIHKKNAVTFQLVHRSQQDPLVVDENAPQRVLIPKSGKVNNDEKLEELRKYGIYFDDDHNYLDYLKDVKDNKMEWPENAEEKVLESQTQTRLKLPSSVFPSEVEEVTKMLNNTALASEPQLSLDPDVVAAMNDDFDYSDPENQLEDNFLELANGDASNLIVTLDCQFIHSDPENQLDDAFSNLTNREASDQGLLEEEDCELISNIDDEEIQELASLSESQESEPKEETKSIFKDYPMTSAGLARNEHQQLLDARFEKFYDDFCNDNMDGLDSEETHVPLSSEMLSKYAEEMDKSRQRQPLDRPDEDVINKTKELLKRQSKEKEEFITITVPEKTKSECRRSLIRYSNTQRELKPKNDKIVTDKKTGIPKNVLDADKVTPYTLYELDKSSCDSNGSEDSDGDLSEEAREAAATKDSLNSRLTALSIRPNNETSDERRERKRQLKLYRKERRIEKKLCRNGFKDENRKQVKNTINNRNNVQGIKIY